LFVCVLTDFYSYCNHLFFVFEAELTTNFFLFKTKYLLSFVLICASTMCAFQDGISEVNRLLNFLQVDLDETLKQSIIEQCKFENMVAEKTKLKFVFDAQPEELKLAFFRKGIHVCVTH